MQVVEAKMLCKLKVTVLTNCFSRSGLIVQREIEIKSRDRAKLHNPSMYVYREGHGMRGSKLDYRFSNAKVILIDIFNGLEKGHAETFQ
jgi:hypothetical protein